MLWCRRPKIQNRHRLSAVRQILQSRFFHLYSLGIFARYYPRYSQIAVKEPLRRREPYLVFPILPRLRLKTILTVTLSLKLPLSKKTKPTC